MKILRLLPWSLPVVLLPGVSLADEGDTPEVRVQTIERPIRLDGVLDEPEWQSAQLIDTFRMHLPETDGSPPGVTEVRVLQDEQHLYFGVRFGDGDTLQPAWLSTRDETPDKRFAILLDTNRDRQTAYILFLNALGRQQDFLWFNGDWNVQFDMQFRSQGRQTEDGFELEIAVPFRSLSYADSADVQDWGVIFARTDPSLGNYYSFPHLTDALFVDPRMLQHAADLTGVTPPASRIGVEVAGTLTGVQSADRDEDGVLQWSGTDPWYEAVRPGAELKLRLTPNVQLSVVGNPDFSDVESDATLFDLNERFTWERSEGRDFFIADANRFDDELSTLYTRSMVQPVYGAQFAGVSGPATFGMLNVLDRAPAWSLDWNGTPGWTEDDVRDAMAMTTSARMKVRVAGSDLGIVAAEKQLIGGSGSRNTVSGLDVRVPLTDQVYFIGAGQRSVTTDAEDTARGGHRAAATLTRPSGNGFRWRLHMTDISQDFRAEMAFLPDTALNLSEGYIERFITPGGVVSNITPRVSGYYRRDRDGEQWQGQSVSTQVTLSRIHKVSAQVNTDDLKLVSGDSGRMVRGQLEYTRDSISTVSYNLGGAYGQNWHWGVSAVALGVRGWAGLTLRTSSNLFVTTTTELAQVSPEGSTPENAATLRTRADWQLTQGLRLRLIEELGNNTAWQQRWLTSSVLLHYQARVGTEAWIGYSERRDLLGADSEEHLAFIKFTGNLRR